MWATVRKALVSVVHEEGSEQDKQQLSTLLCHNVNTAKRYYNIVKRRKEAAQAVGMLHEIRKTKSSTETETQASKLKQKDSPVKKPKSPVVPSSTCTSVKPESGNAPNP